MMRPTTLFKAVRQVGTTKNQIASFATKSLVWNDPLNLAGQLTEEERMIHASAKAYADEQLMARVTTASREETFDKEIMKEMGGLGLLGATIHGYDCAGVGYVSYGLIANAIESADSGYRSAMSVQSSLVMHPIYTFGSEEQKSKYLPELAKGNLIGCFGLTEPNHGSDPGGMESRARKQSDGSYILNGAKNWITNSPVADVFVIWAKDDEGDIRGLFLKKICLDFRHLSLKENARFARLLLV
jgi:glutaryl-CoA dehydrogenase